MTSAQANTINLTAATLPAGLRIIIAGGGTGGHIFPAIAIANALKKMQPAINILFMGAKGKMEMEKIPQAGYEIKGLDIAGFNRSSLMKNIWLPFKLVKSFLQVRNIMLTYKPDAVIGVGGYSSFPVLKNAQLRGIPTFIHESNSFAGRSNIMLGKKATKIFVATSGMEKFFPANKIVVTGNPVRSSITQSGTTRSAGQAFFNLDESKQTVLAIGGSLGAKTINDAINNKLEMFERHNLQLIWQTGKSASEQHKDITPFSNIWKGEFIQQMEMAYAAADVVISRSGAMAVTELCVVAKPVVFVPYPYAAEDHQTVNARHLVQHNAAIMIADSEADNKLVDEVINLAHNHALQLTLKNNISKLAITNADEAIANEIALALKKSRK